MDELCLEEKERMSKPHTTPYKGGIRAVLFIVGMFYGIYRGSLALALFATNGIRPNLILYLMKEYKMEMAKGSNIVFIWTAATYFTPIIASILADSFIGRFRTNASGIIIAFLGMVLFWLTTMIPQLRPSSSSSSSSSSATNFQIFILWVSLGLTSLGSGLIATSLSFGADQFQQQQNQGIRNIMIKRYINWSYAFTSFFVFLAYSFLVYIQDKVGWKVGFGIPAAVLFFSFLVFILPSPFYYVKLKAKSGWVTQLVQVIVAAYRKRNIIDLNHDLMMNYSYHHKEGSSLILPTEKLRFLNRACIILNDTSHDQDDDPWNLCTVEQVEDLKSVIKVIPVWFIGMLMEVSMTQITILTLQAKSMNRKLPGSNFEIPPGSFVMFGMLSVAVWVPLYNYIVLPIASFIKSKPVNNLGMKLRMGIGIFLACLCLLLNGIVENIRRRRAIKVNSNWYQDGAVETHIWKDHWTTWDLHLERSINNTNNNNNNRVNYINNNMSAMWLLPQLFLGGITESIFATAQIEFFYLELPASMASTSSILFQVEYSIANLLSTLFMSITDNLSKKGGRKESWISSNINKGHYDYFFWVISGFCMVDMVFYLVWCRAYGPCKGEIREITDEEEEEVHLDI